MALVTNTCEYSILKPNIEYHILVRNNSLKSNNEYFTNNKMESIEIAEHTKVTYNLYTSMHYFKTKQWISLVIAYKLHTFIH